MIGVCMVLLLQVYHLYLREGYTQIDYMPGCEMMGVCMVKHTYNVLQIWSVSLWCLWRYWLTYQCCLYGDIVGVCVVFVAILINSALLSLWRYNRCFYGVCMVIILSCLQCTTVLTTGIWSLFWTVCACMVFPICRWLTVYHSCELNRLTRKSTTLTPIKAKATHIQMSDDNGCRKEKTSGLELMGFFIIILTPKLMKGFVKSMISSRDDVIVRGARAISAFYINKRSK